MRYICAGSAARSTETPEPEGEHHEEGTGEQLRHADDDPAGARQENRNAVAQAALPFGRQETQEVHLFADLRHQRQNDGGGRAEFHQIEIRDRSRRAGGVVNTGKGAPEIVFFPVQQGDEHERQDVEDDPEGLGDDLETADEPHAMGNERNDHDGRDDVADPERNAERQFQRAGHDRRFDGEEHEGEGGIDQRGDGGADITEARAARQKIDVDAVTDGVTADRQADGQHGDGGDEDGVKGVGGAVGERDRPADGFQRQKGNRADGGVGNAVGGKLPGALGGEAQRIIFQRLVGDPAVIFAPDGDDALPCGHAYLAPFRNGPLTAAPTCRHPPSAHGR